jgi:hypothetical protein
MKRGSYHQLIIIIIIFFHSLCQGISCSSLLGLSQNNRTNTSLEWMKLKDEWWVEDSLSEYLV